MEKIKLGSNLLGFSIIELMIVVSIAGILAAIALPSYRDLVKDNCLTTSTNLLVGSFQQARSEATKRKKDVTVATVGDDWGSGWKITYANDPDNTNPGNTDPDNTDPNGQPGLTPTPEEKTNTTLIRTIELSCKSLTIKESGGDNSFVYGPDGFIDKIGVFNICDDRKKETGRQVKISVTGRPNTNSNYTECL